MDDNAAQSAGLPTYRGLWLRIRDDLPKKGRKTDAVDGREPSLPGPLEGALHSLYGNYEKSFRRWEETAGVLDGSTPPVFIVVCNNTNVSKLVFDYVAGWHKALPDGGSVVVPGKLDLFSNESAGRWSSRPKTVLVDSTQLESGDTMSAEFKAAATRPGWRWRWPAPGSCAPASRTTCWRTPRRARPRRPRSPAARRSATARPAMCARGSSTSGCRTSP